MSRKKNFTPTIFFAVVVAGLVAFSLFDYKKYKQEKGLGENEQKLLTLTEGEVVGIEIRSKKQNLILKSEGGVWHLLSPLQDDADDTAIVGLLNALKEAKITPVSLEARKAPEIEWSQYGLQPGVEVSITTDQSKKDSFTISDTNAYDGSFYVRRGDELFLGERGLARIADIAVSSLRSHNVWRTKGENIRAEMEYVYNGEPRHVILTKEQDGWKITPEFDLPLSQEKVKDWLQAFRDFRANDFATNAITEKTIEQYGLKNPSMKVSFKVKNDGHDVDVVWYMGQEKDNQVFIRSSLLPDIYKATKFSLRDVRIPAEQLLDANKALEFPIEDVVSVSLTIDGKTREIPKGDELVGMFQKLRGLEPIAAETPAGLTFDANKNRLVVKGHRDVLLDLTWTDVKEQLRGLKISKFKERFKVSSERMNALLGQTAPATQGKQQ